MADAAFHEEQAQDGSLSRPLGSMRLEKRLAIGILPSFLHGYFDPDHGPCPEPMHLENHSRPDHLAFLDGMRGLAAICVYIEHFALPFRPAIYHPFQDLERSSIVQLPIIRLIYSGSPMVCLFFVVSGVALSLKPAQLAAKRDWNAVYAHLESSLFRRGIRLFLPALVASLSVLLATSFNLCNAKADIEYQGANEASENWNLQPSALPSFGLQFKDWLGFFMAGVIVPSTWRGTGSIDDYADTRRHEYGMQLWTIPVEYWSSALLFASFIATAKARAHVRPLLFTAFAILSLCVKRWDAGLFLSGSALAHLWYLRHGRKPNTLTWEVFWSAILVIGLFMASFPEVNSQHAPGYVWLSYLSKRSRLWQSIGAVAITAAIGHSPLLQRPLSSRLLQYFGQISFGLYLVHVPLLAIFGWHVVPLMWSIVGKNTSVQDNVGFVLGLTLITPIVIWAADIFCRAVDRPCNDLGRLVEKRLKYAPEEMLDLLEQQRIDSRDTYT